MNNPTVFIVTGVKKNFPGVSVLSMVYTMQDAIKVIVETLKGEGHVAAVTMLFTDIEIGGDAWVYEDWAWNIDNMSVNVPKGLNENVTVCESCGSRVKGTWTPEELEKMAKYTAKHAEGTINIEYEKRCGKIWAMHKNVANFGWIVGQGFIERD